VTLDGMTGLPAGTKVASRVARALLPPALPLLGSEMLHGRSLVLRVERPAKEGTMARFDDQVVVITGGGAGIGRTYAHRFAAEGAAVVIADLDEVAARRVVDEVIAEGGHGIANAMDVTDADAVAAMVEHAVAELGGVDALVNNAGIHLDHAQLPFTLDAVEQWRAVLDVNVIGALICAAACRPAMAARGGGAIVNMS